VNTFSSVQIMKYTLHFMRLMKFLFQVPTFIFLFVVIKCELVLVNGNYEIYFAFYAFGKIPVPAFLLVLVI